MDKGWNRPEETLVETGLTIVDDVASITDFHDSGFGQQSSHQRSTEHRFSARVAIVISGDECRLNGRTIVTGQIILLGQLGQVGAGNAIDGGLEDGVGKLSSTGAVAAILFILRVGVGIVGRALVPVQLVVELHHHALVGGGGGTRGGIGQDRGGLGAAVQDGIASLVGLPGDQYGSRVRGRLGQRSGGFRR